MAETTASRLQRLQLSAVDLKNMTAAIKPGEPWPDALVEDYLNILRDLFTLAGEIDANAGEIFRQLEQLNQLVGRNISQIGKIRSENSTQDKILKNLQGSFAQASRVSKVNAKVSQVRSDLLNWSFLKGMMLKIEGDNLDDPIVNQQFNVTSVVRNSPGDYTVNLTNGEILGQEIIDQSAFSVSWRIDVSANTDLFSVEVAKVDDTTLSINVYEITVGAGGAGSDLVKTAYDFQNGDFIQIALLMDYGDETLIPE